MDGPTVRYDMMDFAPSRDWTQPVSCRVSIINCAVLFCSSMCINLWLLGFSRKGSVLCTKDMVFEIHGYIVDVTLISDS
jgi:hypothetical protein